MAENENAIVNTEATLSESKLVAPGTGNKLSPNPHNFGFTKQVKTDTLPMSGEFNTIYIVPNGNEFLFWKWNEQHEWERVVNDSIPSLQAKKGNNVANTKVVTPQKTAFEKVFQGDVGINGDLYYQGKKLSIKDVDGKVTVDEIDSENQVAGKVIVADGEGGAEWGDVAASGLEIIEHTGTDTIADCVNSNVPYVLKYSGNYYLARVYEQRAGQVIGYRFEFEDMTDRGRYSGSLSASDGQTTTLSSIFANDNTIYYQSYALTNEIAPKYDNTATYDIGDIVSIGGYIYRCNTPITTAENFNPGNWTAIKVSEIPNIPVYSLADITKPDYGGGYYNFGDIHSWCDKNVFVYCNYLINRVSVSYYDPIANKIKSQDAYEINNDDITYIFDEFATLEDINNSIISSHLLKIVTSSNGPFSIEEYFKIVTNGNGFSLSLLPTIESFNDATFTVDFTEDPLVILQKMMLVAAFGGIGMLVSYGYEGEFLFHNSDSVYDEVTIVNGCNLKGNKIPNSFFKDIYSILAGTPSFTSGLDIDSFISFEDETKQYEVALHYDVSDPSNPDISLTFHCQNKTTANSVNYLTTEPSANNTDGDIKVVVLSSEPASRFDGYLYIITE